MRRVRLTNSRNESLDITNTVIFYNGLSGYGFERDLAVHKVGSRWVKLRKEYRQIPIGGKITFAGARPYEDYQKFVSFCDADKLSLFYSPMDKEYQKDVELTRIEKTEITPYGVLECEIEFTPLTLWMVPFSHSVVYNTQDNENAGWIWKGTEGAVNWGITWLNDNNGEVVIESNTTEPSPCRLTIEGPTTNPRWVQYVNDKKFAEGVVKVTLNQNERLIIDSSVYPSKVEIRNQQDEVVSDAYQYTDFAYDVFPVLQYGKNRIHVSGNDDNLLGFSIEGMLLYGTV